MYSVDTEARNKKGRETFFKTGIINKGHVREEIERSWKRSKARNLDERLSCINLPLKSEKNIVGTMITDYLRDYILPNIISNLYVSLERYKGALFYAYGNGVVFSQRGNKEMLRYLNSLNIGIGSCLNEEYIGTTAMSLINELNQEAWVIGEEHYLDIFTPFATHCFCSNEFNERVYTFIVIPKEQFTALFLSYARMFHESWKSTTESYRKELELCMKNELYDQLLENNNKAILFIDLFGKIISANENFSSWFQVELEQIKNKDCLQLLPELKGALKCLNTGEKICFKEIVFEKAPVHKQFMRMDVTPMIRNGEISGLIVTLMDSISIRHKVNKSSTTQAYYTFNNILAESKIMKDIKQKAMNASLSSSSIIITGESGTGKELFAQSIHNNSSRRGGPFIALNCATLQPELIASELFGYVEGAFTGAKKGGSMGKFEFAHQGTIFLDEIGELPLFAQTMLLRVLEERTVTRVGSHISVPIDVRVISATNRDLKKMVKEGSFRSDLYYRINVIPIHLPSLKDRMVDIPILVEHNINYFNTFLGKKVKGISKEALSGLVSYHWPGNLRELRNAVECSMNNVLGDTILIENLPPDILEFLEDDNMKGILLKDSLEDEFHKEEKKKILCLMLECNGNKSTVAGALGVSRSTLYRKLKEYQLG